MLRADRSAIHQHEADPASPDEAHALPEHFGAADVEDAQPARQRREQRLEECEAPLPQPRGERSGSTRVTGSVVP